MRRCIDVPPSLNEKTGLLFNSGNYTVINLYLYIFGPTNEGVLTRNLLIFQCLCSALSFFVRYKLSTYLYWWRARPKWKNEFLWFFHFYFCEGKQLRHVTFFNMLLLVSLLICCVVIAQLVEDVCMKDTTIFCSQTSDFADLDQVVGEVCK